MSVGVGAGGGVGNAAHASAKEWLTPRSSTVMTAARGALLGKLLLVLLVVASRVLQDGVNGAAPISCNIYDGSWVPGKPAYNPNSKCILGRFNCVGKGKGHNPGSYRWKPNGCTLPEFSAKTFLSCMRDRKLQFVGDSLSGNWLASLKCLLGGEKTTTDSLGNMLFPDYNFSVGHIRSNHLVAKSTQIVKKRKEKAEVPILQVNVADPGWQGRSQGATDIVFVTGPHWSPASRFYQDGGKLVPKVHPSVAIGHAAKAAAAATADFPGRRFFMSFPPDHFRNGAWNKGGNCDSFRGPLSEGDYKAPQLSIPHNTALEKALDGTGVQILNITALMGMRPDAHPAQLQSFMIAGGKRGQDCVHWCLPGVPDSWTEVLSYELGCLLPLGTS